METTFISKKEQELNQIKNLLKNKEKNVVKLKGLLKGVEVSEKDIDEARRSLFHSE